MLDAQAINSRLDAAFERLLRVYARLGGHNYYGWDDYADPRNFKGPTFWTESDCVYRLALELEREFPHQVHLELPVARWSFADFDKTVDKQERVDLVVSDLLDFVEDETSQERFMARPHELFIEVKYFPFGCAKTWLFDHLGKVPAILADAARLARHVERRHCLAAAVLVVDDEDLFEDHRPDEWPEPVRLLLASPREVERRGIKAEAERITINQHQAQSGDGLGIPDPMLVPRAHRDPREVERKLGLLDGPHIRPLTDFVNRLRQKHGPESVPWCDPTEAGVDAPILLLLENPGRRAAVTHGSGFISADNDDPSANNTWHIFKEAGIDRRHDIVVWNIVPWYLGDERAIGKATTRDLDQARDALVELLGLLPKLRVVVLLGRVAQKGWDRLSPAASVVVLRAPHTSGQSLNPHPENRQKIVDTLARARELALR